MSIIVHILNETIVLQCIHKSWNKIGPSNFKIPNEVKAKNDTNGKNIIIKYLFTISVKNEITTVSFAQKKPMNQQLY